MELNKQVCSLELAQKLKELGVKQESLFYWNFYDSPEEPILDHIDSCPLRYMEELVSAYTVAELGDLLPEPDGRGWVDFTKLKGRYVVTFKVNSLKKLASFQSPTEADARAKMLIYLAENGLLDVKTLTNK